MTPMAAWSIVSSSLADYYRIRRDKYFEQGVMDRGYTDSDLDAEVVCFKALQEMEERIEKQKRNCG